MFFLNVYSMLYDRYLAFLQLDLTFFGEDRLATLSIHCLVGIFNVKLLIYLHVRSPEV